VLRKDMKRKKQVGGKMDYKWQGPYKVVKSVGKEILNTNDLTQTLKVHGTHLKLFYLYMHVYAVHRCVHMFRNCRQLVVSPHLMMKVIIVKTQIQAVEKGPLLVPL